MRSLHAWCESALTLSWQSQWTDLALNTVKAILGEWATSSRPTRREEVVLSRVRMNCTRLTHLTPYINRAFPPVCQDCDTVLSISHLILRCSRFTRERNSLVNYCRLKNTPFTLNTDIGDGNPEVTDLLMLFLRDPLDR